MKPIFQQTTTKYSVFDTHEFNRVVIDEYGFKPRKDLLESMKRDGFRKTNPIICVTQPRGRLKIVDGHNRFLTAKYLGIPVEYLEYPASEEISPLQFSVDIKAWAAKDFVSAYTADGNANYAEVADFIRKTGIPHQAAFSMFNGEISSSGNCSKKVKSGEFKIKDRQTPWLVASITEQIGKHCSFSSAINLVHAISKSMYAEGFNPARMIERINKNPDLLKKRRSIEEYIDLLDLIYNRNTKGEKLYFHVEIEKAMKKRSACSFN